jgi:hypothetical protein
MVLHWVYCAVLSASNLTPGTPAVPFCSALTLTALAPISDRQASPHVVEANDSGTSEGIQENFVLHFKR